MATKVTIAPAGRPSDKKKIPKTALTIFRENAIKYTRLNRCQAALEDFNFVLEEFSEDLRAVKERCKANLRCYHLKTAEADAGHALQIDPDDIFALYLKGKTYFLRNEFEKALVSFHRGARRRRKPSYFQDGICAANEVIEDCVGRNVGPVLIDAPEYIREMEKQSNKKFRREKPPEPTLQERQRRKKHDRFLAEKYLGRMHLDKRFIEFMQRHPDLTSPNRAGSLQLKTLVERALDLLHGQQRALYRRRPLYLDRYREATFSQSLKRRKKMERDMKLQQIRSVANGLLERMRKARTEKNLKEFVSAMSRAKAFLDSLSVSQLPKKELYLEAVYNISALAYLDLRIPDPEDGERQNKAEIMVYFGMSPSDMASNEEFVGVIKPPFIDYRGVVKLVDERIQSAESALERAWLYHEAAVANCEMGKIDAGRIAAKRCLTEGKALSNFAWCVNACVVLTKIEMMQRNKLEAKMAMQDAIDFCERLKNEYVMKYLQMASEVIDEVNFDEMRLSGMEGREKTIINIISSANVRNEVAMLFQRMSIMPAERRMSLVPGIRPVDVKRTSKFPMGQWPSAVVPTSKRFSFRRD